MRIRLTPGSMGAVGLAIDLFGIERVDAGSWLTPVWVNDVTEGELETARDLLAEQGISVEEEPSPARPSSRV